MINFLCNLLFLMVFGVSFYQVFEKRGTEIQTRLLKEPPKGIVLEVCPQKKLASHKAIPQVNCAGYPYADICPVAMMPGSQPPTGGPKESIPTAGAFDIHLGGQNVLYQNSDPPSGYQTPPNPNPNPAPTYDQLRKAMEAYTALGRLQEVSFSLPSPERVSFGTKCPYGVFKEARDF